MKIAFIFCSYVAAFWNCGNNNSDCVFLTPHTIAVFLWAIKFLYVSGKCFMDGQFNIIMVKLLWVLHCYYDSEKNKLLLTILFESYFCFVFNIFYAFVQMSFGFAGVIKHIVRLIIRLADNRQFI